MSKRCDRPEMTVRFHNPNPAGMLADFLVKVYAQRLAEMEREGTLESPVKRGDT